MGSKQLTARQILLVLLGFVIFTSGGFFVLFVIVPLGPAMVGAKHDPQFQALAITGTIAAAASLWFGWLVRAALRDRRDGIRRRPAKAGRFHVWFGIAITLVGVVATFLTYKWASESGRGTYTLFWGMIAWGIIHATIGLARLD